MHYENQVKIKSRWFNVFVFLALLLLSLGVHAQGNSSRPKNIIILFADGTTASQYEFGRYTSEKLRQESFAITDIVMSKGYSQLMSTESANYFVTDSAAAASAMSTGYKVNNGAISVTPNGERPETLLKFAKANEASLASLDRPAKLQRFNSWAKSICGEDADYNDHAAWCRDWYEAAWKDLIGVSSDVPFEK